MTIDEAMDLLKKLKLHHEVSYRHSIRVAIVSIEIAALMDISREDQENLYIGALLHDIGKLKVSQEILSSPRKLSDVEFEEIKKHPEYGIEILRENNISCNEEIKEIILTHHERLSGVGYPRNLKGNEISLLAKIVAVADSFDAMTERRSYNNPFDKEMALNVISGEDYDVKVIQALKILMKKKAFLAR